MQASQIAIEREFEALRDIRRRSSSQGGPGSLLLDPDLPAEQLGSAPPLLPQAWAAKDTDSPKSPVRVQDDDATNVEGNSGGDDPFNLFWVPAHLHPELAPGEFRAFLREHARAPPADGSAATPLGRSSSSASGLGRKKSMLSRQYKPRDNDGVEEEQVVPLRRNKSIFAHEGPQLTISDLQKLEQLADEASKSEDPTKLRRMLRRSMTLNVAPSFLDQMDDVPDTTDEADAPIIVPPPNQILRRTARTKIRKPNLSGDGGGHRFPASRKTTGRANSIDVATSPTDGSSSSHGHGEIETTPFPLLPTRKKTLEPDEHNDGRRLTYTEETSIFDAYADSLEDDKSPSPPPTGPQTTRVVLDASPLLQLSRPSYSEPTVSLQPKPQPQPLQPQPLLQPQPNTAPVLHQPQPQRLSPQPQQALQQPSRTPSPEPSSSSFEIPRPDSRSSVTSEAPSLHSVASTASDRRKEKDKKSLWRKVGGSADKTAKKNGKEKEKDKDKDKDKDSGFFGSLFGGGKKKNEENAPSNLGGGAGPATAAALLGASKSNNKAYSPSISPQLGNPYARYPIHVERAVYRLSHIKLANPRRPLYEQVLISNLMFWYLGVINKANQGPGQNQNQIQNQHTQGQTGGAGAGQDGTQTPSPADQEKEQAERVKREQEEREKAERERVERERAEAKEKMEQRREARRGSLTKVPPGGGAGSGGRRAEMPVKGPQYHLQSQVIEQEYGGGVPGPAPVVRTSSAPPPSIAQSQSYGGGYSSRAQSMQPMPKQPMPPHQSPQQQQQMYGQPNGNQNYYYGRSASLDFSAAPSAPSSSNLPPGAMAPVAASDPSWLASQTQSLGGGGGPSSRGPPPPSQGYSQSTDFTYSQQSPRTSRSPPPGTVNSAYEWNRNGDIAGAKTPTRSLSANAVAPIPPQHHHAHLTHGHHAHHGGPPPHNGGLKKKMASASAVSPDRRQQRTSEDEDVPLAMWQAQRRK